MPSFQKVFLDKKRKQLEQELTQKRAQFEQEMEELAKKVKKGLGSRKSLALMADIQFNKLRGRNSRTERNLSQERMSVGISAVEMINNFKKEMLKKERKRRELERNKVISREVSSSSSGDLGSPEKSSQRHKSFYLGKGLELQKQNSSGSSHDFNNSLGRRKRTLPPRLSTLNQTEGPRATLRRGPSLLDQISPGKPPRIAEINENEEFDSTKSPAFAFKNSANLRTDMDASRERQHFLKKGNNSQQKSAERFRFQKVKYDGAGSTLSSHHQGAKSVQKIASQILQKQKAAQSRSRVNLTQVQNPTPWQESQTEREEESG